VAGLFGQALTAFQGFFTRGFWFGSFLPVAIFAALNLSLAHFAFGTWADDVIKDVVTDKWAWGTPIIVVLIVAAYAMAPLVPLCRAVLDGRRLPDALFELLRQYPLAEQRRAFAELADSGSLVAQIQQLRGMAENRFPIDRTTGVVLATVSNRAAIRSAMSAVRRQEMILNRGQLPEIEDLRAAVDAVANALRRNDATQDPDLGDLDAQILDAVGTALDNARTQYERQLERYKKLPRDVQPTAIGNARNQSELYSQSVYNVEFAFLWPRVQMVIPENDPIAKRIDAARSLVDFAVLSLVLAVALLAIWLPILAMQGASPWPFLILGAGGPVLVRFFYQLVVESQISLGEIAQGVVDRFRFDLLKMLHIKPPATLSAERELWSTLSAVVRGDAQNADFVWTGP
jgi:hypothetical protein